MSDELKLCPFCGSKARYRNFQTAEDEVTAFVECTGCEAHTMAVSDAYADKRAAVHYWNTRHTPEAVKGVVEALREFVSTYENGCFLLDSAYQDATAALKAYKIHIGE